MPEPCHGWREHCLARSRFLPLDARRRAGAAAHGPTRPWPPTTPPQSALPAALSAAMPPRPSGQSAAGRAAGPGSRGHRPCRGVRMRRAPRRRVGPAPRQDGRPASAGWVPPIWAAGPGRFARLRHAASGRRRSRPSAHAIPTCCFPAV